MFRITHNTLRYFSFAEILVMVAINQLEAERRIRARRANWDVNHCWAA
jgi:hypothetical protein